MPKHRKKQSNININQDLTMDELNKKENKGLSSKTNKKNASLELAIFLKEVEFFMYKKLIRETKLIGINNFFINLLIFFALVVNNLVFSFFKSPDGDELEYFYINFFQIPMAIFMVFFGIYYFFGAYFFYAQDFGYSENQKALQVMEKEVFSLKEQYYSLIENNKELTYSLGERLSLFHKICKNELKFYCATAIPNVCRILMDGSEYNFKKIINIAYLLNGFTALFFLHLFKAIVFNSLINQVHRKTIETHKNRNKKVHALLDQLVDRPDNCFIFYVEKISIELIDLTFIFIKYNKDRGKHIPAKYYLLLLKTCVEKFFDLETCFSKKEEFLGFFCANEKSLLKINEPTIKLALDWFDKALKQFEIIEKDISNFQSKNRKYIEDHGITFSVEDDDDFILEAYAFFRHADSQALYYDFPLTDEVKPEAPKYIRGLVSVSSDVSSKENINNINNVNIISPLVSPSGERGVGSSLIGHSSLFNEKKTGNRKIGGKDNSSLDTKETDPELQKGYEHRIGRWLFKVPEFYHFDEITRKKIENALNAATIHGSSKTEEPAWLRRNSLGKQGLKFGEKVKLKLNHDPMRFFGTIESDGDKKTVVLTEDRELERRAHLSR